MIDFAQIIKGSVLKLKDGRTVYVTGLYLSGDGPVFMVKSNPNAAVAENVPLSFVETVL